jgi:hypothetical protein
LKPVKQCETQLIGAVDMLGRLLGSDADQITEKIIILRPIDPADVAGIRAGLKVGFASDAAIIPEVDRSAGAFTFGIKSQAAWLHGGGGV